MPLSLTLNSPTDRKGAGNDISINYSDSNGTGSGSRRGVATLYEFCGIVEAEDLPGLEMELDSRGHEVQWPPHTAAEQDADAHNILYRALFPLLPELSKALVLTIVNWAPTERELPMRQFLINVGPPQVSEATCLGIVKYPRLAECPVSQRVSRDHGNGSVAGDSEAAGSTEGSGSAGAQSGLPPPPPPKSPLLGSNVKRLGRPHSRSSGSIEASSSSSGGGGGAPQTDSTLRGSSSMTNATTMGSADGSQLGAPGVPAEVGARLLTQYAQWQAVGRVLMRVMLGLQANHVLQADYFAQLLMNENVIPAMFWWLGTASLDLCTALPSALRTHSFSAAYARARQRRQTRTGPATESASASSAGTTTTARSGASLQQQEEEAPAACELALRGIHDCLRSLRRLTSHNGLRKGLLYKNKAPYFYGRLLRVNSAPVQQIAAELLRDIMPVASKRQKHIMLDTVAQVYLRAPVGLSDTFWLAEYGLDPQIEMHRHVELLRLLHYYHHQAFGLRLPRDPALFPSLVAHAVDALVPRTQKHHASGDTLVSETAGNRGASRTASSHRRRAERKGSCKQSGPAASDHSWLLWESDLEDTLNDVYASPIGAGSSG
ncbi:hypothetical protein LPJ61_004874 [Coemansia biformis]|uniref:Far11/STRP C-terminal domain-containing protein n=1 Tax=Coemansia biformis TaxID=1286918 RepID=A0A9W8CWU3_9FUNG|nr:hypothetical protein LPJ61_004874 [Coemansia biformis]